MNRPTSREDLPSPEALAKYIEAVDELMVCAAAANGYLFSLSYDGIGAGDALAAMRSAMIRVSVASNAL